jgi:tetratricopeptide (TPR) repeat protein
MSIKRILEVYLKKVSLTIVLVLFFMSTSQLRAAGDIDIDTSASNETSAVTPTVALDTPIIVSTPVVQSTPDPSVQSSNATAPENPTGDQTVVPSTTPMTAEGVLKMKDVYKAGLGYYKKQDFSSAIRYLKQSLQIHDPYTPKFYYAEANAMLGVIYEFNIIDKKLSYEYYQEALRIDPSTATAKKHIKEVMDNTDSQ